jgi:hypothetical protein
MKKYYKSVITITVLTEDYPVSASTPIEVVGREITNGDWSGEVELVSTTELAESEMAKALIDQGSDPEFFGITNN